MSASKTGDPIDSGTQIGNWIRIENKDTYPADNKVADFRGLATFAITGKTIKQFTLVSTGDNPGTTPLSSTDANSNVQQAYISPLTMQVGADCSCSA